MADIFDVNQYKSENDRLTLTPDQKNVITTEMYQAYTTMKKNNIKTKKTLWTKGIAAALALAIIGGAAHFGLSNANKPSNWFSINASAASATADEVNPTGIDGLKTKGNAVGAMTGFFMESEDSTLTKDGYKDYFAYYFMEDFGITGANVKSVKVESNKKGIYYTLNPRDETVDYLSDKDTIKASLAEDGYKEINTLNNSQYTFDELSKQAPYLLYPCDGFVYDNGKVSTGEEKNIFPDKSIDIILESDHTDPQIAAWTKEIGKIKNSYEKDGYEKYAALEEKIQKKMLDNAKISVTVTYADDTTETQVIDLVYKCNRIIKLDI